MVWEQVSGTEAGVSHESQGRHEQQQHHVVDKRKTTTEDIQTDLSQDGIQLSASTARLQQEHMQVWPLSCKCRQTCWRQAGQQGNIRAVRIGVLRQDCKNCGSLDLQQFSNISKGCKEGNCGNKKNKENNMLPIHGGRPRHK